ncbi:MAG: hypothetical protein M3Y93_03740 [Pseudomonadota bacterium]|nr:hypothetical protein [Pseudomonadota bacterium]
MFRRLFTVVLPLLAALLFTTVFAQSFSRTQVDMLRTLRRLPNPLARYEYLIRVIPRLSGNDQGLAEQFRSFALAELGVYNQAVLSFPLVSERPQGLTLPDRASWKGVDALDVILRMATDRRIVMINEAHHNAHTRELTLALLPRLRTLGFGYFAAEALSNDDQGLMQRGYPVQTSGTEYLQEPLYGEIVREAIRLGFVIVPYESASNEPGARDAEQAGNLYRKVFAKDPAARLFVDAGYAHIDKARGRLGDVEPMAMHLAKLTGFEPLSIDQTQFLETGYDRTDDYHLLSHRFPARSPEVLVDRVSGKAWSALPQLYDLNVILPPALNVKTFGDEVTSTFVGARLKDVSDPARLVTGSLIAWNEMQRPGWLSLGGQRQPWAISTDLCRSRVPCVVGARYLGERDAATAADRYAFIQPYSRSTLYLFPGRYRLRASNADGRTLSERIIAVTGH